jgi:glycosyltransferase involved in cell wall biosynthesis
VSHTFVMREVEALRRRGVDVRTFTVRRASRESLLTEADRKADATTIALLPPRWPTLLMAHGSSLLGCPSAWFGTLRRALALAPPGGRGRLWQVFYFAEAIQLWRSCLRQDVGHVHAHFANVGADVALLAADHGARAGRGPRTWSFTMHGPAEFYDVGRYRLSEKARDAALVVCISDFCRSQMMGLVPHDQWPKLELIHCGVEPDAFTAARDRDGRADSPLEILNVARLAEVKGQAVLLEAIARLRAEGLEVRATIVGDGPQRATLQARAADLGIADAVELTGAVGQDRLREYYERADVFCAPSFAEGVPVVLMEAMATELPVIATRVMGVPELVDDGVSGRLVAPGRADALADAIRELARDGSARRRMGREGRAKVVAEFDVDASAAALAELLATR